MPPPPAKHMNLTAEEAWAVYTYVRPDMYQREALVKIYERDAALLRRIRIGQRFRCCDLRARWKTVKVPISGLLERAYWCGIVTVDGLNGSDRIYRRVK